MSSVKGKVGKRVSDELRGKQDEMSNVETARNWSEDWSDETVESAQLRQLLIQAGRAAMPRHDPARLDRVFRRILSRLAEEDARGARKGVPVARLESPSGVTAKLFG